MSIPHILLEPVPCLEVGKAILSQALKVEFFNKRASTPYKLNIKGVKDAIEEATKD